MKARAGYYLKIPFVWQPGCPVPGQATHLCFRPAPNDWLEDALSEVLATSLDPATQLAVAENGAPRAAAMLLGLSKPHFEQDPDWWQLAQTKAGEQVGFVLCSTFARSGSQPLEGTIFYMGVLLAYRGKGYGRQLLNQGTRTLVNIGACRILCDTAACNTPMLAAFRRAGYLERQVWERPLR